MKCCQPFAYITVQFENFKLRENYHTNDENKCLINLSDGQAEVVLPLLLSITYLFCHAYIMLLAENVLYRCVSTPHAPVIFSFPLKRRIVI